MILRKIIYVEDNMMKYMSVTRFLNRMGIYDIRHRLYAKKENFVECADDLKKWERYYHRK